MTDRCECPPEAGAVTCVSRTILSAVPCPTNQQVGKPVDTLTLKALLAASLTQLTATDYFFCRDPHCPTVYYSGDGTQLFSEADLRERVFQKHPDDDDVWACYCFRHTVGEVRASVQATGSTSVIEAINAGIQAGQCACDIRNPQGSCCLGNVRALVRRFEVETAGGEG